MILEVWKAAAERAFSLCCADTGERKANRQDDRREIMVTGLKTGEYHRNIEAKIEVPHE